MRILVGYDGSECAKAAVEDLVLAGLPVDAQARVLSVADLLVKVPFEHDGLSPGAAKGSGTSTLVHKARALAARVLRDARQASIEGAEMLTTLFPGWRVTAEVIADSPYWALVRLGDEWRADLVVVGSHGRNAVERLFLGGVSQNVLAHSRCSVRIARTREREPAAPPRLILAVDGSANAALAVEEVARRRWIEGTQVRVVTAVDPQLALAVAYPLTAPYPPMGACAPDAERDLAAAARACADLAARRLTERGLAATVVVEERDPKTLLLEQAREWPADGIFIGARGHRQLERFLIGSVSAAVAARAPCTVEVVRGRGTHERT